MLLGDTLQGLLIGYITTMLNSSQLKKTNWILSDPSDWMFNSAWSSVNPNTEETSDDYHSKWLAVVCRFHSGKLCVPKDIINLVEDFRLLLSPLRDI